MYQPKVGDRVKVTFNDAVISEVQAGPGRGVTVSYRSGAVAPKHGQFFYFPERYDSVTIEGPPEPTYTVGDLIERDGGRSIAVKISDTHWQVVEGTSNWVVSQKVALQYCSRVIRQNGVYL